MKSSLKGSLTCKRWFCAFLVSVLLLCAVSASAQTTVGFTRNPNGGSYVNLRLSCSYSGIIADRIPVGTPVEILKNAGDWLYVSVSGNTGYIHRNFVSQDVSSCGQTARVTNGSLLLRAAPDTNAAVMGIYPQDTCVTVLGASGVWSHVRCGNQTGYMLSSYLRPESSCTPTVPTPETPHSNAAVSTRNGGRLNLRQSASAASAALASFPNGTRVQVLTHGSLWCKVRVGNWVGYMKTAYLAFDGGRVAASTAVVNNPSSDQVLHLRARPSKASASLGQYKNGKQITVLDTGSQWCRVKADGKTGYMMTRYLTLYYAAESAEKQVIHPAGTYVNLRNKASYEGDILMQVKSGTPVTVLAPMGQWSRVRAGNLEGYMLSSFLK